MNVYDFDGTIYRGDSTVDFFGYAVRKNPLLLRYLPKQLWGFLLFALKRIDKTALKEYFFCFLPAIDIEKTVEEFWDLNQDRIYAWYLQQKREDDIVISASPEFLLLPICERLGIGHLLASRVNTADGTFVGENCRGQEKVRRLVAEYGITRVEAFYSDSLSDLPLASIAEKAYLVKRGRVSKWRA